jgi:hypothetical protein
MKKRGTGEDEAKCSRRYKDLNKNCKTDTFKSKFIAAPVEDVPAPIEDDELEEAAPEPTEPGCYLYSEQGCPAHNGWRNKPGEWIKDKWGMKKRGTGEDEAKCSRRYIDLNKNCKTDTFKSKFIAAPVEKVKLEEESNQETSIETKLEEVPNLLSSPAPSENNSDIIKQPTLTKGLTVENVTPSPVYYEPGTRIYGGLGYSPSHSDVANMNNKLTSKLEEVDNSDNRGFCAMSGNTMVNIDEKCRTLSNDVCASTDCCVLLGNEKCVQGDIHGPTKKGVYSDTTIKNRDHYYYTGKCYGNC